MNRQASFEALWAARHNLPVETLAQYRFDTKDGYRLPNMAAHYRTHCEALDQAKDGPATIVLSDQAADHFERILAENPMSENGALQSLLAREPRWADEEVKP